ncbi:MAG TPA: hypothetical protein PLS31_03175 [Candidatus Sumerlaeota bacterium]|nr:hypothetical protein [Candidatus Sumerlaeota bacterium]
MKSGKGRGKSGHGLSHAPDARIKVPQMPDETTNSDDLPAVPLAPNL